MSNDDQSVEIEILQESIPFFPKVDNPITSTITGDRGWNLVRKEISRQSSNIQSAKNWKILVNKSMQKFFGVDWDCETQSNLPVNTNKNLVGWNEREFKILQNKNLFGGKLKYEAFKDYIENIDEKLLDDADNYAHYKKTKTVLPMSRDEKLPNLLERRLSNPLKKWNSEDSKKKEPKSESDFDRIQAKRSEEEARSVEYNIEGPCDAFTHTCTTRIPGMGFFGRLFDYTLDPNKDSDLYTQLINTTINHRAYFTYWVTFVQILIFVGSLIAYGFAPLGFTSTKKENLVTTIILEKELMNYEVKNNFWIGPSAIDLVHLGSKYAPCMRKDLEIYQRIEQDRLIEKETACCVRYDRGGCVQTYESKCLNMSSRWDKWKKESEISIKRNRTSGSVCGQDPDFCNDPGSKHWIDDITQWPICSKPSLVINSSVEKNQHMFCEVIGRPCCIGLQGQCIITTLEHCDFMRGYFHEEASLCSQVDCMQDVCGMMDFLDPKSPDQVYRLFTSIFIHAGIIQLLISIFFQFFILRDLENLAGCLRIGIIYSGSGILGNLASAIFLPYQAEAGPAASHFGILACSFIELFQIWKLYENPWIPFSKLVIFMVSLFIIGLLPMIDNFANIFGFISGLILGTIFFPNVSGRKSKIFKRVFIFFISIVILVFYVGLMASLFYFKPIANCEWCKFISCPFGSKFCLDSDFNIIRIFQ